MALLISVLSNMSELSRARVPRRFAAFALANSDRKHDAAFLTSVMGLQYAALSRCHQGDHSENGSGDGSVLFKIGHDGAPDLDVGPCKLTKKKRHKNEQFHLLSMIQAGQRRWRQLGSKVLAFVTLLCPYALPQVKSGTVIIIFFSKDKVVLAGDSRVVVTEERGDTKHRDDECKIFALRDNVIYAASGAIGHDLLPGDIGTAWDAHQEAANIASHSTDIVLIANTWAARMKERIDKDLIDFPRLFRSSNLLLSAVFAGLDTSNKLTAYSVTLTCECSLSFTRYAVVDVRREDPVNAGLPFDIMGKRQAKATFKELMTGQTLRAAQERRHWKTFRGKNRDANVTIRTTEFIIRNAETDEIGGDVDALEIDISGRSRWIRRKKNCLERTSP